MNRIDPFMTRADTRKALSRATAAVIDREGRYELVTASEMVEYLERLGKKFVGSDQLALRQRRASKTSYIAELWADNSGRTFVVLVEGPAAPRLDEDSSALAEVIQHPLTSD